MLYLLAGAWKVNVLGLEMILMHILAEIGLH